MKIIGITGPSGSGKSLLGELARSLGFPVIDADEVYHSMLVPPSECLDALRTSFGNDIFLPNGELCRKSLAKIVFSDSEKLKLLNSTVLDKVLIEIRKMISELENEGASIVFVDAPTLIESGFNKECDTVISVLASRETRIKRITARDGITSEKAEERINAQKDDDFYRENSDHIINNDSSAENFFSKASILLKGLK